MVMQCPKNDPIRIKMYDALYQHNGNLRVIFADNPSETFNWLIGKVIEGIDLNDMYDFWKISGTHIVEMYRRVCAVSEKTGVG